jgi:phosphonate transport system ATP-binding protein
VVYDGAPNGLTAEVLTDIYGAEDWSATIRKESAEESPVAEEEEPLTEKKLAVAR